MSKFEKYVDSDGTSFLVHEKVLEQIGDVDDLLYVNSKGHPTCPRRLQHEKEFGDIVDDCVVYAQITEWERDGLPVWFGWIWGKTWKVYLGIGTTSRIKKRAMEYQEFLKENDVEFEFDGEGRSDKNLVMK